MNVIYAEYNFYGYDNNIVLFPGRKAHFKWAIRQELATLNV